MSIQSQLILFVAVILAIFPLVTVAHGGDRVVMEPLVTKFTSDSWVQERGITSVDYITCSFVMKLNRVTMDIFENKVLGISTPSHSAYGSFLTNSQISQHISPSPDNIQLVLEFLSRYGVDDHNDKGNTVKVNALRTMIQVRMLASTAEELLQTQFVHYRSVIERDVAIFRVSRPYSLPAEIAAVVALVDDIVRYPAVARPLLTYGHQDSGITDEELRTQETIGKLKYNTENPYLHCGNDCYGYSTPALLQKLYGYSVPEAESVGAQYTGTGIAAFNHRPYDARNIDKFVDMCGVNGHSSENTATVGGHSESESESEQSCGLGACMQTTMQMEYVRAVGGGLPLTVYYDDNFSLARWLSWLIEDPTAPLVNVLSLVNEDSSQNSAEYMDSINYHFIIAAAKGLTLLCASGDDGSWGRNGVRGVRYQPNFPASAPWITSVGGSNAIPTAVSNIDMGITEPMEESVWECSGGGFSDYFPIPKYQNAHVNEFLGKGAYQNSLPPSGLYNASGRGFPDIVSLAGETNPFCVVVRRGKGTIGMSSTSGAVAVVGALFSSLNHARMNNGKNALGFLNPLLYSDNAHACYKDINDQSENHCHIGSNGQGFKTSDGWDAASGFGTMHYNCMQSLVT